MSTTEGETMKVGKLCDVCGRNKKEAGGAIVWDEAKQSFICPRCKAKESK